MDRYPLSPSRYDATLFLKRFLGNRKKENVKILDVGCGKLFFYDLLWDIKVHGQYLGIDIDPSVNFKVNPNLETKIIKRDFLETKNNQTFDFVVCLWVLEHVKKDREVVKKMIYNLGSKSYLIVIVPSVWTWPIEFGRHGYRYYSKRKLASLLNSEYKFKTVQTYNAGGILGLLFMLIYSWPRFLILVPSFIIFILLSKSKIIKSSWKEFSTNIIRNSWYAYHRIHFLVRLHNLIAKLIVRVDNHFKITPSSYIFILKKK